MKQTKKGMTLDEAVKNLYKHIMEISVDKRRRYNLVMRPKKRKE